MIGTAAFCECPPPAQRAAQLNTEAAAAEIEAAALLLEADRLSKQANDLRHRRDQFDVMADRAFDEARAKRMHARALMASRPPSAFL